jgi:hypothetical protein
MPPAPIGLDDPVMRKRLTGSQRGSAVSRVSDRTGRRRVERGAEERIGAAVPFEQGGGVAPEIAVVGAGLD